MGRGGRRSSLIPFSCAYGYLRRYLISFWILSDDEINQELRFVGAGILAMANAGPNTNGELFLNLSSFVSNETAALEAMPVFLISKVKFENQKTKRFTQEASFS